LTAFVERADVGGAANRDEAAHVQVLIQVVEEVYRNDRSQAVANQEHIAVCGQEVQDVVHDVRARLFVAHVTSHLIEIHDWQVPEDQLGNGLPYRVGNEIEAKGSDTGSDAQQSLYASLPTLEVTACVAFVFRFVSYGGNLPALPSVRR
jgi:hypothetical protein